MGFSLTSPLGQPAAGCHGNREPVEGVDCIAGVQAIGFRVTVFADLNWPADKNARARARADAFLILFPCVCVCEQEEADEGYGKNVSDKTAKSFPSPWLRDFNIFLH